MLLACDLSSKKSSKKAPSTKSKSSSRSATTKPKIESADKRLDALEKKMEEQYSSIFQLIQSLGNSQVRPAKENWSAQLPSSVPLEKDDRQVEVSGPSQSDVHGPSGIRRHLLPLNKR